MSSVPQPIPLVLPDCTVVGVKPTRGRKKHLRRNLLTNRTVYRGNPVYWLLLSTAYIVCWLRQAIVSPKNFVFCDPMFFMCIQQCFEISRRRPLSSSASFATPRCSRDRAPRSVYMSILCPPSSVIYRVLSKIGAIDRGGGERFDKLH